LGIVMASVFINDDWKGTNTMRCRIHSKTGNRISEIDMGSVCLYGVEHNEAIAALRTAYEGGIVYFDLVAGDGLAVEHYRTLEKIAADCVHYDRRCPFGVNRNERMGESAVIMEGLR